MISKLCGTTATVCLILGDTELVVGHVGDSRALLCRKDTALPLTTDHDPESIFEVERITTCGGRITWNPQSPRPRVNGILEMTRSIGDVELKQYGVKAEPDVQQLEV
jgi:protein phosphatase 1K